MADPIIFQGVTFHHSSEALLPPPPINWLIENLTTRQSLCVLAGEGGSFKTYSSLDMAVCVSAGLNWLDFPTRQAGVLFVDEESGLHRFNRRLGDCIRGHLLQDQELPIWSICLERVNFFAAPDRWASILRAAVENLNIGLIVVDALIDVISPGDENSSSEVGQVMRELRQLTEDLSICIWLIHHFNRAKTFRGNAVIRDLCDLLLTVEYNKDTKTLTFASNKERDIDKLTFSAIPHFAEKEFWLSSTATVEAAPTFGKGEKHVLDYLDAHGPSPVPAICGAAAICSEDTARKAVYSLAERGLIRRVDSGGKGTTAVYALSQQTVVPSCVEVVSLHNLVQG